MLTIAYKNEMLSRLGFGTMRLPLLPDGSKTIDEEQVQAMVDYAIANGINYFDTAYPYHDGNSEIVIGKALSKYPRESFNLATKFPGHQIMSKYDPAGVFEEQLKKCGVEYFDFYLLHNVYENSIPVYEDDKWGIMDYFFEQRRLGRIRHLGFSSHALPETLEGFLAKYADQLDFCQIQLNYLDWTLQDAKRKVEILNRYNMPIWVMEPVRGGKLASLSDEAAAKLRAFRPDASQASWAFRFLQEIPGVTMVLSGMSNMEQMKDNVKTYESLAPLSDAERAALFEIADGLKNAVPCTACRYCVAGCPAGLEIPKLLALYNEISTAPSFNLGMIVDSIPQDKQPSACLSCGACARTCPQKINIPECMKDFDAKLRQLPRWADICREREEAANRRKAQANA